MVARTVTFCDMCIAERREDTLAEKPVQFPMDGTTMTFDVCPQHRAAWEELQERLQGWLNIARPLDVQPEPARPARTRSPRRAETSDQRAENARVRQWARDQGIPIGDKGRISDDLRTRYHAAMAALAAAPAGPTPPPAPSPLSMPNGHPGARYRTSEEHALPIDSALAVHAT